MFLVKSFREVDFPGTRHNARTVLRQYRKYARIAGRTMIDIQSPKLSDMPKSPNYNNRTEDALVQFIYAEEERDEILRAIAALNLTYRQILYYAFCEVEHFSNQMIATKLGYSIRTIEQKKAEALVEFAEAYKNGELIKYW